MDKKRCTWVNLDNPLYVEYHDKEWGVPEHDDNSSKRTWGFACYLASGTEDFQRPARQGDDLYRIGDNLFFSSSHWCGQ